MKKRKLQRTILISYTVYALILILCIGTVITVQNIQNKNVECHSDAFTFTKAASAFLDGDAIEEMAASGKTSEYYAELERYFASCVHNSNLLSFYVGVPRENDILFIIDEAKDGCGLLFGETMTYDEFASGAKAFLADAFCQEPAEEVITGYENGVYTATACSPIFNSSGKPVAIVAVDLAVPNLKSEITRTLSHVILVIVILISLSALTFFFVQRKQVITPIQQLNDAVRSMVNRLENEEKPIINIKTGNEIEELAQSFTKMYSEIYDYIERLSAVTAEKERIGAELDVAAKIQAAMLPCIFPPFPTRKEFEIYATMDPAKEVGGDFYDLFLVDDEHLAIVVADVSGKGVPAALFMAIGKTLIKEHTGFHGDLGDVFTEVNNILCSSNTEDMFITAFEGVLNTRTGELRYVNAGHEPPFICKKGGVYELFKVTPGFVLAGIDGFQYKSGCIILNPGDKLFQYTDGVTEANNKSGKLYGMQRLESVLAQNSEKTPTELLGSVKKDIDDFVGDAMQFDDITMLCLEYKGEEAGMKELTIDAVIGNIPQVTDFVDQQLEELGCPVKAQVQIDIAIDELFSNIAHYAYNPEVGPATVRVEVEEDPLSVIITFVDNGIPYDPLAKEDPDITRSVEERELGGLGVFLVKQTMDDISYEYRDGQNILKIKKKL